jgi:outer membrane protein assembly factor BamE (lipoprotein component of BamABCDE complex)
MEVKTLKIMALAIATVALAACGSLDIKDSQGNDLTASGASVKTLTNLHPDEARARLSAVNYQMPGLIPVCTDVTLLDSSKKRLVFKVNSTGRQYNYDYHRSALDPLEIHLQQYFGSQCNSAEIQRLSAVDQEGIRLGKATVGMSKTGVKYAIGYPPKRDTPSLDSNEWKYWSSHFKNMFLVFDAQGKVSEIRQ